MFERERFSLCGENSKARTNNLLRTVILGFPKIAGTFFGGLHSKNYRSLRYILGIPRFMETCICGRKGPRGLSPHEWSLKAPEVFFK